MTYWAFDLLLVALPAALLLRGAVLPPGARRATAALCVVALLWTGPWDEHLVRTGVWSYGPDRVLATVGSVPVEEYAFVVLLVLLTAAWAARTGAWTRTRRPVRPGPAAASRAAGAAAWAVAGLVGALLLVLGGPLRYLGLLLVWVAPPLALQRAVAGDLLAARRPERLLVTLPVALWLCLADRLALADGIWTIAPASSTGLAVLGLPVEEGLFFLLVTALVTDGLLLAVDPRALARARALLARPGRLRSAHELSR